MTRRDLAAAVVGAAMATVVFLTVRTWRSSALGSKSAKRAAERATAAAVIPSGQSSEPDNEAWRSANATLVEQVKFYQERMQQNEAEKATIERELKAAKLKLATSENDGAPPRDEFDLTEQDWKALAKTGTVKARYPCSRDPNWTLPPEKAVAVGLAPSDAPALEAALKREENRMWQSVASSCAEILGSRQLAERLGTNVCIQVVSEAAKDGQADIQLVADVRAGNRPMPAATQLDPYASVLLAETGAMQALTDDLAQTFGPEEAKRIAFGGGTSWCSGSTGGAP
jgi:hypothetical protein